MDLLDEKQEIKTEYPLVTVIVPVYNILQWLPRCVKSIVDQTYEKLEILLVDDGSTDGTGELCDTLAKQDERIRVFHKHNGGSSSARNLGIREAKGEYLAFVDSDDYIEPWMYEELVKGVLDKGVSVAQIGRDEIDEQGNKLPEICIPPAAPECIPQRDFMKELLMHRGDCSFCTKLIRRDLFEGRGFPEGVLNEDFHLLLEMLPDMKQILSLPGQAYHVFYRIGSNSRKESPHQFSRVYGDNVDNADFAAALVLQRFPQDMELQSIAFRFGVFQRIDYLLHIPIEQMEKENSAYKEIVSWMRRNWSASMKNSILSKKNKLYHTLFALSPRGIRRVHRFSMKLRGHG